MVLLLEESLANHLVRQAAFSFPIQPPFAFPIQPLSHDETGCFARSFSPFHPPIQPLLPRHARGLEVA